MPKTNSDITDAENFLRADKHKTTRSRQAKTMPAPRPDTFPKNLVSLIPVLSAIPFATSLIGADNKYLFVNKSFERKYGHTLASLKDRDPSILWPRPTPASGQFLKKIQAAACKGGWSGQLMNITRTGKLLHIALRMMPLAPWPDEHWKSATHAHTSSGTLLLGVACDAGDEDKRDRAIMKIFLARLVEQSARPALSDETAEAALLALQPKRRREIYRLKREGLSDKEIAFALKINGSTVRVVVSKLRQQVGETHIPRLRRSWMKTVYSSRE